MIGKIMSEAAHSIIGMFSAKPVTMENSISNSDFRSLLRSPEEQAHSGSGETEIDTSNIDSVDVGDQDVVPAPHWETNNLLPFINQSFGGTIFSQDRASGEIEQDQVIAETLDLDAPDGKLSFTSAQGLPQNAGPAALAADGEGDQAVARTASDILSAQANVTLGNGSRSGITDGQAADERLLKQHIQQHQIGSEGIEPSELNAKTAKSGEFGQFDDMTRKLAAGTQTPALSPLLTKEVTTKDGRSELGQFGFSSAPREPAPGATAGLPKSTITDGEFFEPAKFEVQPGAKGVDTSTEQQPVASSAAPLAVREPTQKPVAFDMSSPQLAERLAAEIADISVSGGTKKFEINPRNLGRMEIIFNTRGSEEIIEIQTDHRAAKDIIVQHGQLLQDILKSQGRDDLTLRVDVKDNGFLSSKNDGGNLSQQENRDAPEQQARPSQHRQAAPSFDNGAGNAPASDNSRYA